MNVHDEIEKVWCEVLGVADCRPEDNFFERSGTSLKAARFVRALAGRGIRVPLGALFTDGRLAAVQAAATTGEG
ncbi:phosphopantetheine-binding protein [Micromonospora chersina]|uniref:phosphopantetheine-binding protein n=1 Tax=Micromonospora chersina TaxID=47854 RepID=UPI0037189EEE